MSDEAPRVLVHDPFDYYADIGQFVIIYGQAEAMIKHVLRQKAGLSERMSLALLSGVRADAACSLLRRCYVALGDECPPEVDALLSQFQVLTTFRNDLLHHGIEFEMDPPRSTNRESVLHVNAVREHVIERDTLRCASDDCARIVFGMTLLLVAPYTKDELEERRRADLKHCAHEPWQYKGPAPANKGRSDRPTTKPRPARKHPRKSSPE